jgi:hypothetical protein
MYLYIVHRTQIYLTEREANALDRVARETGRTRSSLIREAIEARYLATPDREETLGVLRETFGAWKREPGEGADDGAEFVEKLRPGNLDRKLRRLGR